MWYRRKTQLPTVMSVPEASPTVKTVGLLPKYQYLQNTEYDETTKIWWNKWLIKMFTHKNVLEMSIIECIPVVILLDLILLVNVSDFSMFQHLSAVL